MPRFEYRVESFTHPHGVHNPTPSATDYLARVNELGAKGWMIVPASGLPPGCVLLMREAWGRPQDYGMDPAPGSITFGDA
ncbi:MAG TPA: hypothetical protein VHY10_16265 [Xanthobacteraceae bacterium]|jgi:hypothetical protein|nr:hypothetical protein [Xanthobacteraceae bacterium]